MLSPVSNLLFVGWLVCAQYFLQSTQLITMKLGWRMCLSQEYTPLTVGADPSEGTDPIFSLSLSL